MTIWSDAIETVWPGRDGPDGLLPPLLLLLTVVTGLVDAASYLKLGHVFVANMTGNVVFLGFAIAGAGGLSIWASLVAALALAMGVQNATARRLAVPELTTTVLTMTLTGIAADSTLAGGGGSKIGRRLVAVAAMLVGALIGALLALSLLMAPFLRRSASAARTIAADASPQAVVDALIAKAHAAGLHASVVGQAGGIGEKRAFA